MKLVIKLVVLVFTMYTQAGYAQVKTEQVKQMEYLLEEEKLARDVYDHFYNRYQIKIFRNIKSSEQRHMEMVQSLLTEQGESFPPFNEKGKFYNQELQELYHKLIEQGEKSQQAALEVGKYIEETDIKDLTIALENTDSDLKKKMYSNLIKASRNHLNAFNRWLSME